MKDIIYALSLFLLFASCMDAKEATAGRKCMDDNWLFFRGDIADGEKVEINDNEWRKLDLPHDWSIESQEGAGDSVGIFSKASEGGIATGHTLAGIGWYRHHFITSSEWRGKMLSLYFEGVYMDATVWVNGQQVGRNPYGYTSFWCDITPYCNAVGESNVIAVKVSSLGKNSRWYAGAGIYRHVWFIPQDPLHVDQWGLSVTTSDVSEQNARVKVTTEVVNKDKIGKKFTLRTQLIDKQSMVIAESCVEENIEAGVGMTISREFILEHPVLWSIETPDMYQARVLIECDGEIKNRNEVAFGIRSISFDAAQGFLLNGVAMKLKGGCVHHDNGLLGAVATDRAEERKVELLKKNGFNAVRCAHNPPSEAFLDACDRLGLLVIDEAFDHWLKGKNPQDYHRFFKEWSAKDIRALVKRDRNHPSIIMWSIGNEIPERSDSIGMEVARQLKKEVHRYDTTRPVTAAVNEYWDNPHLKWNASEKAFQTLDVAGYNYMWYEYENDHAKFPERVMYGSETVAKEAAVNWDLIEKHPYIIGDFVWTALDYLGESGIGHALPVAKGDPEPPQFPGWPWFAGWCGDIDLCGNKKPQSLYRDVLWRNSELEMTVHAPLPAGSTEKVSYWGWPHEEVSWNWAVKEGEPMNVHVYTRHPKVRLSLNGNVVGEQTVIVENKYTASFVVPYHRGVLRAEALNAENRLIADKEIESTGKPATIRLTADRTEIRASRNDLSYVNIYVTDNKGRVVTDSNLPLKISLQGNGQVIAGNASPTDMPSFRSLTPKAFKGCALAIVCPTGEKGILTLLVEAEGLPASSLTITAN